MTHQTNPAVVDALRPFFEPKGVAVVGAGSGYSTAGARALGNLVELGYSGGIFPVSRRFDELHGRTCFPSVADVPDPVELAIIAVNARATPVALRECGTVDRAAVLFATGFGADPVLQAELEAAREESGVRVIGPNTVGIRVTRTGLFATFSHDIEGGLRHGTIAVVAQSGGLGVAFGSAYLKRRFAGTGYVVDTGSELDVTTADVVEYVAADAEVSCIGVLIEGAPDGRRLAAAVRTATESGKPVVFYKIGRSRAASAQLESHTGSLAAPAELFDRVMADAGACVVRDEADFMDALVIHELGKAPAGRRLGVVTPSGGYAIMTIDAAEQYEMELPAPERAPSDAQSDALASGVPANPFDWQSRGPARERSRPDALAWMLGQPNIDAVLLWEAYSMEMPERRGLIDAALTEVLADTDKPVFVCGIAPPEFEQRLRSHGVLLFEHPTRLVRALSLVAPPGPVASVVDRDGGHENVPAGPVIGGAAARRLLAAIDHVETHQVTSAAEATAVVRALGTAYLKVESDRYAHKTELGYVEGPVVGDTAAGAFERLVAARAAVDDRCAAIVAQPAISGVELAIGAYLDATFGPVVMVASGGIFLEIMRDSQLLLAPTTVEQAVAAIGRLRGAALLAGVRGRPPADLPAAAAAVVALSEVIATSADDVESIDVNPLIVRVAGAGAVAVDAVVYPRRAGVGVP